MKAENVKLQDNLDTQNKLWKVWIEKIDNNAEGKTSNSKKVHLKEPSDEDVLLIEDENHDEVNDTEDEITEEIFKRFMINAAQTRFKRTSPAEEPVPVFVQNSKYNCAQSGFEANGNRKLNEHINNVHSQRPRTATTKQNSVTPGKRKQFCHYWNNFGSCHFEAKNGRPCKFNHERAPLCRFDGKCDRKMCMFTHRTQNVNFLSNPPKNFQYAFPQRGQWGTPSPWMNQQNQVSPWETMRNQRRGNNGQY